MNYEKGSIIDVESIRQALGGKGFEAFDRRLRDRMAARVYFARKAQEQSAYLRRNIQYAAVNQLGGMRPTAHLCRLYRGWLDIHYPGWDTDDEFLEKDLPRHHPETQIKLATGGATNRVGWTPAVDKQQPQKPASPARGKVVLTDDRGNAAAA